MISGRPRLAVIGASVRAAVQSAMRGGYACHAFDLFADADLSAACPVTRIEAFDDRLLAHLADDRIDAWLYTGGMENYPDLIEQMASIKPLYGCESTALLKVRDPVWLNENLAAAGHAFPPIRTTPPADDGQPWLAKKRTSCGGLGVQRFDANANRGDGQREHYYQPLIPGQSISAMFLATADRCHLLAAFEQWVGLPWTGVPGEFMYCGAFGPLEFERTVMSELEGIGSLLAEQAGLRGLFGIDAILSGDRVTLIEVNPRYTASMELQDRAIGQSQYKPDAQASGSERARQTIGIENSNEDPLACASGLYSAIDLHCRACAGESIDCKLLARVTSQAKAIVYAREAVTIGSEFEALVGEWNSGRWPTIADIPPAGQSIQQGEPICTLFQWGDDRARIIATLKQRIEAIHTRCIRF